MRYGEVVVLVSALITTGITREGHWEILELTPGDSENEACRNAMLKSLQARGKSGVERVASEDDKGLQKTVRKRERVIRIFPSCSLGDPAHRCSYVGMP